MYSSVLYSDRTITDDGKMLSERTRRLLADMRQLCHSRKITQRELAERLGTSPLMVSEWFKGRSLPMREHVLAMREMLRKKQRRYRNRGE